MKRAFSTRSIALLLGLMLVLLSVSVAFAAPPLQLHMVVDEFVFADGEPFLASGPAVANGVICDTGIVTDIYSIPYGSSQGSYTLLNIRKQYDCDDESGTFYINMKVKLDANGYTTAHWKFDGGTNAYINLKGNGKLVGNPNLATNDILDIYDGKVH